MSEGASEKFLPRRRTTNIPFLLLHRISFILNEVRLFFMDDPMSSPESLIFLLKSANRKADVKPYYSVFINESSTLVI